MSVLSRAIAYLTNGLPLPRTLRAELRAQGYDPAQVSDLYSV